MGNNTDINIKMLLDASGFMKEAKSVLSTIAQITKEAAGIKLHFKEFNPRILFLVYETYRTLRDMYQDAQWLTEKFNESLSPPLIKDDNGLTNYFDDRSPAVEKERQERIENDKRRLKERQKVTSKQKSTSPPVILIEEEKILIKISNLIAEKNKALQLGYDHLSKYILDINGQISELQERIKHLKEPLKLPTAEELTKKILPKIEEFKRKQNKLNLKYDENKLNKLFNREKKIEAKDDEKTGNGNWGQNFRDTLLGGVDIASRIASILNVGSHTFAAQLISGLQAGLNLANSIASFIGTLGKLAGSALPGGGILSIIGSFFGFAEGGRVPGSGAGDIVPAMLTPGEFVIRKSIVDKMGSSFFAWINGGLLPSMAGHYAMGGMVSAASSPIVNNSFDVHIDRRGDVHVVQKALQKLKSNRTYFGG